METLSDKIKEIDSEASDWNIGIKDQLIIPKSDVKEFIEKLKKDYFNSDIIQKAFNKRVDKLAGEKLI